MSAHIDVDVTLNLRGAFVRYHCAHTRDRNSWRVESPVGGGSLYLSGTNEEVRAFAAAILAEVDDRERQWLGDAEVAHGA